MSRTPRHPGRPRTVRLLGALLAGLSTMVVAPFPAPAPVVAQAAVERPADLGQRADVVEPLRLVAQEFQVGVDDVLDVTIGLPDGMDSALLGAEGVPAEVVIGVYRSARTRDEVRAAAAGSLGRVGDTLTLSLDPVTADPRIGRPAADQLSLAIPTESANRTPDALQVPLPGIYPLVVDVRVGDEIVAEAVTFIHRPEPDAGVRGELSVGLLLGQTVQPTIAIDGSTEPTEAELVELQRLADVLTRIDEVPAAIGSDLTPPRAVRVQAATLAALPATDPDLFARLVPLLERSQIVATTRLPLDPSTMARNEQQELYGQWLREGEDLLLAAVPRGTIDRTMYLATSNTSTGGAVLRRTLGTRMLVLTPDVYERTPGNIGGFTDTSQLVTIDLGDGGSVPAAVVDRGLAERLDAPTENPVGTAVLMAAEIIGLAEQFTEAGVNVSSHGMILGRSDLGIPDPAVVGPLVEILMTDPSVRMVQPSMLSSIATTLLVDGREISLTLADTVGDDLTTRFESISEISIESLGVASMLPEDDPTIAAWAATLGAMPSTAITNDEVADMIAALRERLDVYRNGIEAPAPFSFTLTGRESNIPIGLRNLTATPLKVRIRMSSAKLRFPDGEVVVELAPRQTTEFRIPVEARSNGRSGVALDILTPATDAQLVPTVTLTARVNALTGLGQLVTGAALLVLATWWIRHWRLSRRRRLAADHHHRHPATPRLADDGSQLAPDAAASSLPPS